MKFRNSCDYIVFSFHNCSCEKIDKSKIIQEIYQSDKLIFLEYNNISYEHSILKSIEKMRHNVYEEVNIETVSFINTNLMNLHFVIHIMMVFILLIFMFKIINGKM